MAVNSVTIIDNNATVEITYAILQPYVITYHNVPYYTFIATYVAPNATWVRR